MSSSDKPKPDLPEKAVGCLFPVIGGFLGVAIGGVVVLLSEPFISSNLDGICEVAGIVLVSGITGLIVFAYYEFKIRK